MNTNIPNSAYFHKDSASVKINTPTSPDQRKLKRRRSILKMGQSRFLGIKKMFLNKDLKISFIPETRRRVREKLVEKGVIKSTLIFGSSIKEIRKVNIKKFSKW